MEVSILILVACVIRRRLLGMPEGSPRKVRSHCQVPLAVMTATSNLPSSGVGCSKAATPPPIDPTLATSTQLAWSSNQVWPSPSRTARWIRLRCMAWAAAEDRERSPPTSRVGGPTPALLACAVPGFAIREPSRGPVARHRCPMSRWPQCWDRMLRAGRSNASRARQEDLAADERQCRLRFPN